MDATRSKTAVKRKSQDIDETPTSPARSPTRSPTSKQNKTRAGDVTGATVNSHADQFDSLEELYNAMNHANEHILKTLKETVGQGNKFSENVAHKLFGVAAENKPKTTKKSATRSMSNDKTKCNECSNLVDEAYTLADWKGEPGLTGVLPKKCLNIPDADKVGPLKLFGAKGLARVAAATLDSVTPLELLSLGVVNLQGEEYPYGIGKTHPTVDDETFAQQRLTGPNPMRLEKVTAIGTLKKKLEVAELSKADNDEIIQSAEAMMKTGKSIYVVDYLFLKKFVNTKNDLGGQIPATFAIFTYDGKVLVPLRIVVVGPNNLRRKAAPGDNAWQFAKRCVQCSDINVHEMKYHLNNTHLMTELIIVATKRILAPAKHFIHHLLDPHFRCTLSLNDGARTNLLPALSKQCGTDLVTLQELVAVSYSEYDFVATYPKNDLKKRGMLKNDEVEIKGYDYATDVLQLWDMLYAFFEGVVEAEYPNKSLDGDKVLKCWVKYIQDVGNMKSFPDLKKPVDLVTALTNIVFSASVQHSAVMYEQAEYFGYVENAPFAIYNWNKLDWNNVNAKVMNYIDPGRRHLQREFVKLLSQPPNTDQTLLYIVENHYAKYGKPQKVLLQGLEDFSAQVRKRKNPNDYIILNPDTRKSTLTAGIYL